MFRVCVCLVPDCVRGSSRALNDWVSEPIGTQGGLYSVRHHVYRVHAHVRWTFPMIDAYLIPSSNAAITILCLSTYLLEKRVTELGALPVCADTVAQVRVVRVL